MPAAGGPAAGAAGAVTVWDLIVADDDLAEIQTLVEGADPSIRAVLADPSERLTMFAPNNGAVAAARASGSFAGRDVTSLLLAHLDSTDTLYTANLFDGARTGVAVTRGAPQPIDQTARTIGGAAVVSGDVTASNGVLHSVSRVFDVQAPVPWWKKPAGIAAILVLLLAILGLIAWLIWGGGDDEEGATATTSALVLEARDIGGDPLDVGFLVGVRGPAAAENSYTWIRPQAVAGDVAGASTGSDGRVVFEWEPDDTVTDPDTWTSSASGVANVPPGWTPPGPIVDCVLDPFEGQESVVSMNIQLDSADETVDRTATFEFPNFTFSVGDTLRCTLDAAAPAPTTSSTVVPTTTPATTTPATTAPATTAPATTAPATTAPATTAPATTLPTPPATAFEALEDAGDFGTFLSLVDQVPSVKDLLEGDDPITVFAPTDDALSGVTPPTDPDDLEQLLLSHIIEGDAFDAAAMTDGRTEIDVATGGQQTVDGAATPPTVGGVDLVVDSLDIESENGFSHGLDGVLPVAAP